jgi:hypothetical protein
MPATAWLSEDSEGMACHLGHQDILGYVATVLIVLI